MQSNVLDDAALREQIDKSQMYRALLSFPYQLEKGWELAGSISIERNKFSRIIVCGMGGSAIGGDMLRDVLRSSANFPVDVIRDYELRQREREALVVGVSYSGNTEETLSSVRQAVEGSMETVLISSGGQLEEFAREKGLKHIRIPAGYQPRAALGFMFSSLLRIADKLGIFNFQHSIMDTIQHVRNVVSSVSIDKPSSANISKQISNWLGDRVPVIACPNELYSAGERMKTQFNENSKRLAWNLFFPESNHNDWIPLMTDRRVGEYRVILLRTISDNKLMKKRMEVVESMLKQRMDVFAIQSTSDNPLNALLEYTVIGDWASYYTALLDAIDPSPVAPIEELKKRLKEK